jgi:hypothetical protein
MLPDPFRGFATTDLATARLVIDPDRCIEEISRKNNTAPLPALP